jgi:probable F420-dependent oxidoreductase
MDLTGVGVWSSALRYGKAPDKREALAELDELGYSAVWVPDSGGDVFGALRTILESTRSLVAASGILNLWAHDAEEVGSGHFALTAAHPGRLLLGIGVSHAPFVERAQPGAYVRPLQRMREYLDQLDAATPTVPVAERVLAALGPKMLELARDRSRGAHPYLVTPEHTAEARSTLGAGPLLAPEQHVVLETDPARAREAARSGLAIYLSLPNYVGNWLRLGFTEADVADGGSDRLVDHVVAWGDEAAIASRVQAHLDAGADHVCVQVIGGADAAVLPRAEWRALAPALVGLDRR